MIIKPEVNFMSRTKKEFDLFLLSFVQIHSHPVSAVLIEFREIGVDPRHECVVILPGQGLTASWMPPSAKAREGIRLPRYRSTSLGIP